MRNRSFHILLALCVAGLLTAISALAQDHGALVGKWSMTSETDNDSVPWTLELKDSDGKLQAFLMTEDSQIAATDFTYEGGVLKFKAPYQGQYYDIELKLSGKELTGTWSGGDASGKTHGTKA